MPVERFLGGAWLSVHGPADPRRLPVWLLDAHFCGAMPSPGPRVIDWDTAHEAAEDLPFRWAGVRACSPLTEANPLAVMASTKDAEQQQAMAVLADAVRRARQIGAPRVVLDPGVVPLFGEVGAEDLAEPGVVWTKDLTGPLLARRKASLNMALDRVCRFLHRLCKAFPDIGFCLTPGRSLRTVGDVVGLEAIFEDLPHARLGYWHDAAISARRQQVLDEAQGEVLEKFRNRLSGMSLGDGSPDGLYLLPGAGGVDWGLLASYVPLQSKPLPAVLELDPSVAPAEMPGVHSFLTKFGL